MEAACDDQRGGITYAQLIVDNAYGWRCRLNIGGTTSYFQIDLNREC